MKSTSNIRRDVIATAVCLALHAGAAGAIELGNATVTSSLGEPLGVTIPVRSAPSLRADCVTVSAAPGSAAVPGVRTMLGGGVLTLTSRSVIREPLLEVIVRAGCPGDVTLSRSYVLMFDLPPVTSYQTAALRTDSAVRSGRPATRSAEPRVDRDRAPLSIGSTYRVRFGDTLSGIAERVDDPQRSIWATANAIFEANPNAFVAGDPDRLKAGAVLSLPGQIATVSRAAGTATAPPPPQTLTREAPTVAPARPETAPAEARQSVLTASRPETDNYADTLFSVLNDGARENRPAVADTNPIDPFVAEPAVNDANPVNPFVEAPAVAPITADITASDEAVADSVDTTQPTDAGGGWTTWLRGAGVAALIAALWWVRKARRSPAPQPTGSSTGARRARIEREADLFERFGSEPVAASAKPAAKPVPVTATPAQAAAPAEPDPVVPDGQAAASKAASPVDDTTIDVRTIPERTVTINTRPPEVAEQSLLERDYEEEFSRTQKLRKQMAAQALQQSLAALSGSAAKDSVAPGETGSDDDATVAMSQKRRLGDNLTDELFNSMITPRPDEDHDDTAALEPIVRDDLTENTVALPNPMASDDDDELTLIDDATLEFTGDHAVDPAAGGASDATDEELDELTAELERELQDAAPRKKQA